MEPNIFSNLFPRAYFGSCSEPLDFSAYPDIFFSNKHFIIILQSCLVTESLRSCCRYVDCFIIHKLVLFLWNLVIL